MSLERASIDELLAEYADAAEAHRAGGRDGDSTLANGSYDRLRAVVLELRARRQERALECLLADSRLGVRGWAAVQVLAIAPDRALPVLEEIASGPSTLEQLSAEMVLKQWYRGTFRPPA